MKRSAKGYNGTTAMSRQSPDVTVSGGPVITFQIIKQYLATPAHRFSLLSKVQFFALPRQRKRVRYPGYLAIEYGQSGSIPCGWSSDPVLVPCRCN